MTVLRKAVDATRNYYVIKLLQLGFCEKLLDGRKLSELTLTELKALRKGSL